MKILVGYTGFVGSNIALSEKFDGYYNSKNIQDAYGTKPDLLIYAGVRGTKFIANKYPEQDRKNIEDAIENIKKICPRKLVLISSVDVYDTLEGVDEDYDPALEKLHVYGRHRLELEEWVEDNVSDYHIIRLPAIYGENLKKNFVHDLIIPAPPYLNNSDYQILKVRNPEIAQNYDDTDNLHRLIHIDRAVLSYFEKSDLNSIRFTDSRSEYQYFNLGLLSEIIQKVIDGKIKIYNVVTECIRSDLLYQAVYGYTFQNFITDNPIKYRLCSKYQLNFKGKVRKKYLLSDTECMDDLVQFIQAKKRQIR